LLYSTCIFQLTGKITVNSLQATLNSWHLFDFLGISSFMGSIQILTISAHALSIAVSLFSHLYILFSMPFTLMLAYYCRPKKISNKSRIHKTKYIGSNIVCFY
jgi:hypothetical protein